MRDLLIRKLVVVGVAAALVLTIPPVARAHHLPNEWCPQDARYCINAKMRSEGRTFWIFRDGDGVRRYRLCVVAPDGSRACRRFRLVEGLDAYSSSVVWREHFPNRGPGAYRVTWRKLDGTRIGRTLGFHSPRL
jgi:hypothetical protein